MSRPGLLIAIFVSVVISIRASAGGPGLDTVTLAWDPSVSPNVAGYRLYQGAASQNYTNVLDVGPQTTATVTGLLQGTTYFFAVTAYDLAGLESSLSQEVSYTTPPSTSARIQLAVNQAGQPTITGTGPPSYQYSILSSPDLRNWTAIGAVAVDATGSFQFIDTTSSLGNTRYYRLQQTYPPQPASPAPAQPPN